MDATRNEGATKLFFDSWRTISPPIYKDKKVAHALEVMQAYNVTLSESKTIYT